MGTGNMARTGGRESGVRCRWGTEGKSHMEEPDVDGNMITKCTLNICWNDGNWHDIGQDRNKWRAFVNTVVKLLVS
jgi:hypothetical protein